MSSALRAHNEEPISSPPHENQPDENRIALVFAYQGESFHGWQKQPNLDATVQGVLEAALSYMAGHAVIATPAGRTDRGVHALRQVAHFDTAARRPLSAWVKGVNARLPETIRVLHAQAVTKDFDARYSATSRSYRYVIHDSLQRSAHVARLTGWVRAPLDPALMQEAAHYLLGEHDFSSFRGADCQAKSPVRTLFQADIYRHENMLCADFNANAFLHHMIRNIMGVLVRVGAGRMPPDWVRDILLARDRRAAANTFEPNGLYFLRAHYPCEHGLLLPPPPAWFWGKKHD